MGPMAPDVHICLQHWSTYIYSVYTYGTMGRTGRTPSELLLTAKDEGPVVMYHAEYLRHLKKIRDIARAALIAAQDRMRNQYNKRIRAMMTLREGMFVWIKHVPRGKGISKWKGPAKILENAGYDNWIVECGWNRNARLLVHSSACVRYHEDEQLMQLILEDGLDELEDNPLYAEDGDVPVDGAKPMVPPPVVPPSVLPCPAALTSYPRIQGEGCDPGAVQDKRFRSVQGPGKLCAERAVPDTQEAQALAELDDCGIRNRERRLGRGGRMIPWVEVRHQGQWKWVTWEQYWDGPMAW